MPALNAFDLVLSFPQWQGSGRPENLRRGAQAAARVCAEYGAMVEVPDAGQGGTQHGVNHWTSILRQFRSAKDTLDTRQPRHVLTAGGDCACDIAIINYLSTRYPNLRVVWIDAHLDANSPTTTPSGDFHGMPVAAIMGSAPPDLQAIMAPSLPAAQFRYVSAHIGDDGDWSFQRQHGLTWLDPSEAFDSPTHIHFDLDSLDPDEFPHVAYPDGKLSIESGLKLVREVASAGSLVGLTVTEFAPVDQAGADEGVSVIKRLCEAALGR